MFLEYPVRDCKHPNISVLPGIRHCQTEVSVQVVRPQFQVPLIQDHPPVFVSIRKPFRKGEVRGRVARMVLDDVLQGLLSVQLPQLYLQAGDIHSGLGIAGVGRQCPSEVLESLPVYRPGARIAHVSQPQTVVSIGPVVASNALPERPFCPLEVTRGKIGVPEAHPCAPVLRISKCCGLKRL